MKNCIVCNKGFTGKSNSQKYCFGCRINEREISKRLSNVRLKMIDRCYNPNAKDYKWYGEKGVKVYIGWLKDQSSFSSWAKNNGYKIGLQLDRTIPTGNYGPDNCRFVSCKENQNNRCNNVTFGDERICSHCKAKKPLKEYHKNKSGNHYVCRECRNKLRRIKGGYYDRRSSKPSLVN